MDTLIRGHFDGKVIIPDEPVELPVGDALEIRVRPANGLTGPLSDAERAPALLVPASFRRRLGPIHT